MKFTSIFFKASAKIFEVYLKDSLFLGEGANKEGNLHRPPSQTNYIFLKIQELLPPPFLRVRSGEPSQADLS